MVLHSGLVYQFHYVTYQYHLPHTSTSVLQTSISVSHTGFMVLHTSIAVYIPSYLAIFSTISYYLPTLFLFIHLLFFFLFFFSNFCNAGSTHTSIFGEHPRMGEQVMCGSVYSYILAIHHYVPNTFLALPNLPNRQILARILANTYVVN